MNNLFSTKKYSKVLNEFNTLSIKEKQIVLTDERIKKRLYKIADINLLFSILIDLPYNFRDIFLNSNLCKKYNTDSEKELISFLKLQNYEDFDYKKITTLNYNKTKQIIPILFRKLSKEKLKNIILEDYSKFINNCAFTEYSKKSIELTLENNIINKVDDNILIIELKRRKTKERKTYIKQEEFISFDTNKKNILLINANIDNIKENIIENIIDSFIQKNLKDSKDILMDRFENLLEDTSYINLIEMQTIIFTIEDDKAEKLIEMFFKKVWNFENIERKYIKSMIFNFKKLNEKTDELYKLTKLSDFSIINYLNTSNIDKNIGKMLSNSITIEQYQKVNIKKLNNINKLLNKLYNNSLTISDDKDIIILSYKLYFIFGYENSIELISGKFGHISFNELYKMIDKCVVKNTNFEMTNKNYEPVLNQDFLNFIIGNKKDSSTTIKKIISGELEIVKKEFSNLYNNFSRFQNTIGNKIHLNKLLPLLNENPFILLPTEYKLTKDIIDNIIKSDEVCNTEDDEDIYKKNKDHIIEACTFYHNYLEKRIKSSIPRVIGNTKDNYSYEVIRLDDPIIMTLGYQTKCCFRLHGMSKEFLKYCSESEFARVIIIKNELGEICSMIPIIRNGNVIVGNSIESNNKKGLDQKIYFALKEAYNNIIKVSSEYEKNPIIACLVTNLHDNCYSTRQVKMKIYPIRRDTFYTNFGHKTYIVSIKDNKNEDDFRFYTPDTIYFDERPKILVYHYSTDTNEKLEVEKRVKSILYRLNKRSDEYMKWSHYIICSEDWVIKVDYDGISGEYIDKDPRAKEEFNAVKNYLEQKLVNKQLYEVFIDENELTDNCLSKDKTKKLIYK